MKTLIGVFSGLVILSGVAISQQKLPHRGRADSPKAEMSKSSKEIKHAAKADVYTCPMHPEVTSDKPGKCPKCKMNLVKMETRKVEKVKAEVYTCPMHPEVKSDKPGKCPQCKMDLVKATKNK